MKKSVVVVMATVLIWVGLGWAALATTDVITVRKVIDGWEPERTGIFGEPKDKCDEFVEEIMSKFGGRKVKLNFIIPGYADPTGPSGPNDDYGLRRAYNVGQYMKSKFIGTYEVEINSWSGGELKNMRAVDAACQIIPVLTPPITATPDAKSSRSLIDHPYFWYWSVSLLITVILLAVLLIAIFQYRNRLNRKLAKQKANEERILVNPRTISDLVHVMNNKDLANREIFCPRCPQKILGRNMKRHLFERCPEIKSEEKEQLSEELNKQRPELEKGERHEKKS